MALWNQIRRSGLQRLVQSYQNPNFISAPVRSFAVPAHVKAKQIEEPSGPRLNGDITAQYVRLVTEQGHDVVSRREALDRAKQLNLDLVEVQRTADPPVCKLMDFHKEKFKQEVKEKEKAKTKSTPQLKNGENKEVRFTSKTELKDLKIKADTMTRLMERGYRVKCTVLPSGKEEEDLRGLLARILALVEDVAIVESGPHVVDTKQAYIIVRHTMFSTKKSGKKAIKALDAVNSIQSVKKNIQEKSLQSDTEDEVLSDQNANDHEEVIVFDAKRNLREDQNSSKPLPQINLKTPIAPPIASKPEPSVVEVNRYAKQSEPNRFPQNKERMPHQATRNETDPKQRQFHPNNPHGRFNSAKPAEFVDRNKLRTPVMSKPINPSSSTPSHGKFNTSQNPSQPRPSYGVFSSTKPAGSSDQRTENRNVPYTENTSNPSSATKSYGIFSANKPVGSGDQKSSSTTKPIFFSNKSKAGSAGA